MNISNVIPNAAGASGKIAFLAKSNENSRCFLETTFQMRLLYLKIYLIVQTKIPKNGQSALKLNSITQLPLSPWKRYILITHGAIDWSCVSTCKWKKTPKELKCKNPKKTYFGCNYYVATLVLNVYSWRADFRKSMSGALQIIQGPIFFPYMNLLPF